MITTDASKSDEELVAMTKNWTIVGQDLLSVVSCKEPYEWKDPTEEEWEFNEDAKTTAAAGKRFKVGNMARVRGQYSGLSVRNGLTTSMRR